MFSGNMFACPISVLVIGYVVGMSSQKHKKWYQWLPCSVFSIKGQALGHACHVCD